MLSETISVPNPTTISCTSCLICCEELNLKTHTCPNCSKNSWKICHQCETRIININNRCPVCRSLLLSRSHSIKTPSRYVLSKAKPVLLFSATFFIFVYLGKIIYWLWCQTQSECPENHFPQGKYENCECHYRISVYNYWYNFQNFLGEVILGGLGIALLIILFSCCFSQTRPQIRN